jgi:cytochrome bd-type quinol oxidase subunit 2
LNGNEATRRTGLAAPAVWLLAFVLLTGGETLAVLNRTVADEAWTEQSWLFLLVSFALTALGALIVAHHPRHAVGWLLCTVGLLFEASFLASEYSYFTLITEPGALPAERAVTTISGSAAPHSSR